MVKIEIDSEGCIACGACVNACPVSLYAIDGGSAKLVGDRENCVICRACESTCPAGIIRVHE
jgi:NAD-dependent dihydropyrimidine dehydrogenase PreA subunit